MDFVSGEILTKDGFESGYIAFEKSKIVDYLRQVYNIEFVVSGEDIGGSLDELRQARDGYKKTSRR